MSYQRVFNNEIYTSDISGEIPVITYKDRGREFYNIADNRKWIVKLVNDAPVLHEVLYLKPATDTVADLDGSEQVQVLLIDGSYALVPISQIQTYIDLIAPVVRYYKALITQAGETDPVAHVLNGSDNDFLGNIVWARASGGGSFTGTLEGAFDLVGSQVVVPGLVLTKTSDDVITLTGADSLLTDTYIEIAVRQRNMTAPTIVSMQTTEDGAKVLVEFDKPMSDYNLAALIPAITVTLDNVADVVTGIVRLADHYTYELTLTTAATSANVVDFAFDASVDMEAKDFALVEAVLTTVVENHVLDFVSAETSEDGTQVILNFTVPMANPSALGEAFEVKIDGVVAPHTSVQLGLPTSQIYINMTDPIANGDVVTVSVTAATVPSAEGTMFAAGLADEAVTNNVPA